MNKELMNKFGFEEEVRKVAQGICPFCDTIINLDDFKDDKSRKEFKISGICQNCQDLVFGKED